ncbi:hypothetical protein GDO81_010793 [Engystomops pustulosus]|uniref:Uncharacterized protein n=1 Tax=Engystomops pustulosus TaxID=76066 RepID=A0AAV7C3S1_ENGPU|nr:hypothetical protein GDO81_010793 [Engystomops pustulosus]
MLGKDYMLAIIIVNYDDNLWSDPTPEADPKLPPGWRTIRDSSGTYYWHVPTGTTQWQHPMYNSGISNSLSTIQEKKVHRMSVTNCSPDQPFPGTTAATDRRPSLQWHDEDLFCNINEPDSKGQNMVMILKKDTMSLVDPLDHSLIHSQPIINIRVWGVGCNNGRDRDFAFVANDKDTCMLKCHVFRCDVPAKAIASALHDMCSKIMSEKAVASNSITRSVTLETISPEDLPIQVDILDTVRESIQRHEVLYLGSMPVSKPMGMDILNTTIENMISTTLREQWTEAVIEVTDTVLTVQHREVEEEPIWQGQVRYVTFIGIGKDPHTFALIMDTGKQCFQCTVFWCEPDAGHVSEAVQAACMVQYQKCVVSTSSRMKSKSGPGRSLLKIKRTASVDSPISPFSSAGHTLQKSSGTSKRRGVMAFFEAFKQRHVRHNP